MTCFTKINKSDYPYITPEEEAYFKYVADLKCCSRNAKNLLRKVILEDKKKNRKIERYKKKLSGPEWYEELTERQIAAANMLFSALTKDRLDCQVKRAIHVLIGIGLKPLPSKKQLAEAAEFSRNSDLAFLWYLYNYVYRSCPDFCKQKKYTQNERIIFSCIAHLDMLVTLRELDKILPKPDLSKIPKNSKEPTPKKQKYPHILPPRPVPPLEIYDMYKDQFYVIENEFNRWFSTEHLVSSESRCVAEKILEEEISKILAQPKSTNDKLLCARHEQESSKIYQLMKNLLTEKGEVEFLEENHKHLSILDRGIAYGMHVEFQKCENKLNEDIDRLEGEAVVNSLLTQIINNSFDRRYLHLCQKCEEISCPIQQCLCEKYQCEDTEDDSDACNKIPKSSSYDPSIVKYYHRPSIDGSHPLIFDYEKIFSMDFLHDHGVVRNSINTALKLNKYLTVDNAITACLRDMWLKTLREWNLMRQAEMEERQKRVVANFNEIGRDKEKILKLLREALAIMRKNAKFVLAALPYSHRLPILREWILQRYGVKYIDESLIKNKYGMDGKYL